MLTEAKKSNTYIEVFKHMVGHSPLPEELIYNEESGAGFDLITASSCMMRGHFDSKCFEEFLQCLRPGGHFAFTILDS